MLPRLRIPSFLLAVLTTVFAVGSAQAQDRPMEFAYPVKFLCGPSSESFQEGMVTGLALTAINILNPSNQEVRFDKRVSRALPYQQEGAQGATQSGQIGPLGAIEVECNEIRQMLPSQMTEEFRTGYLLLRAERELVVTAVYSARPRDGEISTLEVQRVVAIELDGGSTDPNQPDLVISEIRMQDLRVRCPNGQGSCVAAVPVTVSNIGAADAGPFRVRTSFDPGQAQQVFESLGGLAMGDSQTFQAITAPGDNCFDPDCMVCAFADIDMVVSESNESNNELCEERQG